MPRRTSPLEILIRFWVFAFIVALCPYGLLFLMIGAVSLPFLAMIALLVTILFHGLQWVGHQLVFRTLLSDDEQAQKFLNDGGDPWFHLSCPPPFNCDSEQLRITGSGEPEIHWFCNHCAAEAFDLEAPCRVCGWEQWECGRCGTPIHSNGAPCPRCDGRFCQ